VWRWIKSGRLPAVKTGSGPRRIARRDAYRVLRSLSRSASTSDQHGDRQDRHVVQFYEDEGFLSETVADYFVEGFKAGEVGVAVGTPRHTRALNEALRSRGIDLDETSAKGRFISLDARETLARFMVEGMPDGGRFRQTIEPVLLAAQAHGPVRIYGEMVAVLIDQGQEAAAVRLEELWNDLQADRSFALLCAYPLQSFSGARFRSVLTDICGTHSRVLPAESFARIDCDEQRLRAVAMLQQQAVSLEVESAGRDIAERGLRQSEDRYDAFVSRSSEGIWRCELEEPIAVTEPVDGQIDHLYRFGHLAECNDAMARMYEYERADEIAGARLPDLLPSDVPANRDYLRAFVESGYQLDDAESEEVARDGSTRHFLNNLVGIVENGALVRAWGTQRDITQRKRMEERLEHAIRARDEFLSLAAHELKTPLTSLKGFSQLLARGRVEPEQAIDRIIRQTDRLDHLVSELLDLARVEVSGVAPDRQPTDLVALVTELAEQASAIDPSRGIRVRRSPLSAVGHWDSERLRQVIENLLSNAIKYSPDGGHILIDIDRDAVEVRLTVEDGGMGMAADELPKVFDRYYRSERSARVSSGFGVGLHIARSIVEAHGGRIWAESDGPGRGSRFVFTLPTGDNAQA
jgi:PAS domain S-box-containing protein